MIKVSKLVGIGLTAFTISLCCNQIGKRSVGVDAGLIDALAAKPQSINNNAFLNVFSVWIDMGYELNDNNAKVLIKEKSNSIGSFYSSTVPVSIKKQNTFEKGQKLYTFESLVYPHYGKLNIKNQIVAASRILFGIRSYYNGDSTDFSYKETGVTIGLSRDRELVLESNPDSLYRYNLVNTKEYDFDLPTEFDYVKNYELPVLCGKEYLATNGNFHTYTKPSMTKEDTSAVFAGIYDSDFNQLYDDQCDPISISNKNVLNQNKDVKLYFKHTISLNNYDRLSESNSNIQKYMGGENGYYLEGVGGELPIPEKRGYIFKGWYDTEDYSGNQVTSIPSNSIRNDFKFYAKWERATISYDLCGGTLSVSNFNYLPTTSDYSEFNSPSKFGYTFKGWCDENNQKIDNLTGWEGKHVNLHATYDAIIYSVSYENTGLFSGVTNPNTDFKSYNIETPDYTLLPASKKDNTFIGWYDNENFDGEPYTVIHGSDQRNYQLYPRFVQTNYDIKYNLNGGTNNGNNPPKYSYENETILYEPTRSGYSFDGWYEGENRIEVIPIHSTGNKTLSAKWTPITYSVTYELDGGQHSNNPQGFNVESEDITLQPATKVGHIFIGWFNELNEKVEKIVKGTIGNIKLTAKYDLDYDWEVEEFIKNYMHPEISFDDHSYTSNCVSNYSNAKAAYKALTQDAKQIFCNDEKYVNYKYRLEAWANANHETFIGIELSPVQMRGNIFFNEESTNNVQLIMLISFVGISSILGFFFFRRKTNE